MSLLRRLRNTVRPPLKRLKGSDEDAHFRLRLPARDDQAGDWLAFDCAITTREDADGEHLRLRSHLRADFSRLLPARDTVRRERLAAPVSAGRGGALQRLGGGAGQLLERAVSTALDTPLARRALAPLADQRVESWMDLHGTTAPRDDDTQAMLPKGLARIGVMPDRDGPPVQSWASPTPTGMAQITTLQIDEQQLTGRRRQSGDKPLRLAATFAQVVEQADGRDDD